MVEMIAVLFACILGRRRGREGFSSVSIPFFFNYFLKQPQGAFAEVLCSGCLDSQGASKAIGRETDHGPGKRLDMEIVHGREEELRLGTQGKC